MILVLVYVEVVPKQARSLTDACGNQSKRNIARMGIQILRAPLGARGNFTVQAGDVRDVNDQLTSKGSDTQRYPGKAISFAVLISIIVWHTDIDKEFVTNVINISKVGKDLAVRSPTQPRL